MPTAHRLLALALALVPIAPAAAQPPAPFELTRLAARVEVDGVPNDAAWRDVPPLPLTMYAPVFRGTPTQRSEIRVAYDDEALYAAGWFYDSDRAGIRVNSLYRDRWNGDDAFAVYVDGFGDRRNSKWFGTTPGGIRFDLLVSDDGATVNGSWDTFWTARTTVTGEGWFAEVRIPFSSLGVRVDAAGRAIMGLTVTRLVSRTGERVTFPEIDPRLDYRRPSVTREVAIRDVRPRRPLYVTPYALAGQSRSASSRGARQREVGLDVRYPLTNELTIDVTANTDFAQAEADEQQVNLDRFPLFFPERRRFFQEGSGIFDFGLAGNARLFHSRRIGLTTALRPVPVLGGARVVGRVGGWDVGLLDMQTEAAHGQPAANSGVLRLRRGVLNAWSTVGGMATSFADRGRRNTALAADGVFRPHGDTFVTVKVASTFDGADSARSLASRSQADLRVERRVERGPSYSLTLARSGRGFDPALGFTQRRDFTIASAVGNWYLFTDRHPVLRRLYPGALAFTTIRNADGAVESGQYAVWVQWDTKAGGGGWLEPKLFRENVLAPFSIGRRTRIPAGVYDFADLQLALAMSSGRRLRTTLDARAGTYFDGTRRQVIVAPTWNVSPHLELGGDYQATALRFARRDQSETIHLLRARVRAALDARLSANVFAQYNSPAGRVDANVRVRFAFAEGTDLWLVYDEGVDTDRAIVGGTREARSLSRTLLLKYTRTFGL